MTGYRISPRLPVLFSPLLVCPYLTLTCISGALFLFYAPKFLKCPKIILSFLHYLYFNAKIPHLSAGFLPASRLSTRLGRGEHFRTPGAISIRSSAWPIPQRNSSNSNYRSPLMQAPSAPAGSPSQRSDGPSRKNAHRHMRDRCPNRPHRQN